MFVRFFLTTLSLLLAGCFEAIYDPDIRPIPESSEDMSRKELCQRRFQFDEDRVNFCTHAWIKISNSTSSDLEIRRDGRYLIRIYVETGDYIRDSTLSVEAKIQTSNGVETLPLRRQGSQHFFEMWHDRSLAACSDEPIQVDVTARAELNSLVPGDASSYPSIIQGNLTFQPSFTGGDIYVDTIPASQCSGTSGPYEACVGFTHYMKGSAFPIDSVRVRCRVGGVLEDCGDREDNPVAGFTTYPELPTTLSCGSTFWVLPTCNPPHYGVATVTLETPQGLLHPEAGCDPDTGG